MRFLPSLKATMKRDSSVKRILDRCCLIQRRWRRRHAARGHRLPESSCKKIVNAALLKCSPAAGNGRRADLDVDHSHQLTSQRGGGDRRSRNVEMCRKRSSCLLVQRGRPERGLLSRSARDTEPLLKPLDDGMVHFHMPRHFIHGYAIVLPRKGSATV